MIPDRVWVSLSKEDGTPRGVWNVAEGPGSALPSAHQLVEYVPAEHNQYRTQLEFADKVFTAITEALGYQRWWPVPSDPARIMLERDAITPGHIEVIPLLTAITQTEGSHDA